MNARRRPGIEAVQDAMAEAAPAVYLVPIDGIPRAFLSPAEFAAICGVRVERIHKLINDGEILTVEGFHTRSHRIPTSELARWQTKACPLDATA